MARVVLAASSMESLILRIKTISNMDVRNFIGRNFIAFKKPNFNLLENLDFHLIK